MLSGDRVVLRPLRPDDLEQFWQARQDPLTWARTEELPLLPQTLEAYRAVRAARPPSDDAEFAVDVEGVLAGRGALFHIDPLTRAAEIGILLLPDARGLGLGKDVMTVLVDYAFRSRNLRRVHLQTLASNAAAVATYRAVGFVEEGLLREHAWVEGRYEDVLLMAVLRDQRG